MHLKWASVSFLWDTKTVLKMKAQDLLFISCVVFISSFSVQLCCAQPRQAKEGKLH